MSNLNKTFDKVAADELYLYLWNDYPTYKQSLIPCINNLYRKQKKGVYSHEKAVKAYEYVVEFAARRYCFEFGGTWFKVFTKATRTYVA